MPIFFNVEQTAGDVLNDEVTAALKTPFSGDLIDEAVNAYMHSWGNLPKFSTPAGMAYRNAMAAALRTVAAKLR